MATTTTNINQTEKTSYEAKKIDYTSKDYTNILDDLINSIPGITAKWESSDANDPGLILVKLMSILGDMLFYSLDIQSLEVYPSSVTLRKNAATIYKLIGYKMKWYRSATLEATVVNTYTAAATLPRFCTFTSTDGTITYTTFRQYELPANTNNSGVVTSVELIEGTPVTPPRSSSVPYPSSSAPWHSIYGYNYTVENIINNRLYLNDVNIDQDHIIVIDDQNETWALKENIYLTRDVGKFFEFDVDVNDRPYIELIDYWSNYNIKRFKVFYIRSNGEAGQVYSNVLTRCTGNVWAIIPTANSNNQMYNVNSFIQFTHYPSTLGYNPETPDEARKESVKYQNTLDTIITLKDFENVTLREPGVANVRATDLTNDPGTYQNNKLGDINMDGTIDDMDWIMLTNYLNDPQQYPLTDYEKELANCTQSVSGYPTQADADLLYEYIHTDQTQMTDAQRTAFLNHVSPIGELDVVGIQELPGFTVRLYILRTEEYEVVDEEFEDEFKSTIQSDLQSYKILPLDVEILLDQIKKYYWTITGTFFTKTPLSRDELQTMIININNNLKHNFSREKVNFNTTVNYRQIIDIILETDSRILMVDLDPITYVDDEGNNVDKSAITGKYTQTVPLLTNPNPADNLKYTIKLTNPPILPNSLIISVNDGQAVLKDNGNKSIYNVDNILAKNGKVDYRNGTITLQFTNELVTPLQITYTKNQANVALYRNLNTNSFSFDSSSLEETINPNLV